MRIQQKDSHQPPITPVSCPHYERIMRFSNLASLRQQGTRMKEFALKFSAAAEGLGLGDAALKDLFNYALDEPRSYWTMIGLERLTFEKFLNYVERQGSPPAGEVADPPEVAVESATETVTPTPRSPKRRRRRKTPSVTVSVVPIPVDPVPVVPSPV
ncbi:hypothetical protein PO909_030107, partial [Leuciscus waleckii]